MTPLTEKAVFQIYAKCDTVMEMLMERLGWEIPPFELQRRIVVGAKPSTLTGRVQLYARGADKEDAALPVALLEGAMWSLEGSQHRAMHADNNSNDGVQKVVVPATAVSGPCSVEVSFKGHYCEPALTLEVPLRLESSELATEAPLAEAPSSIEALSSTESPSSIEQSSVRLTFKQLQQQAIESGVSSRNAYMAISKSELRALILQTHPCEDRAPAGTQPKSCSISQSVSGIQCITPIEVVYDVAYNLETEEWRVVSSEMSDGAQPTTSANGVTNQYGVSHREYVL